MRALWSDRQNCSHNVSQKVKRIRRFSDQKLRCSKRKTAVQHWKKLHCEKAALSCRIPADFKFQAPTFRHPRLGTHVYDHSDARSRFLGAVWEDSLKYLVEGFLEGAGKGFLFQGFLEGFLEGVLFLVLARTFTRLTRIPGLSAVLFPDLFRPKQSKTEHAQEWHLFFRAKARLRATLVIFPSDCGLFGGSQKGGFQKGGFGGCSLDPQNSDEGTEKERRTPTTGTRVQKKERRYQQPEREHIRQNRPKLHKTAPNCSPSSLRCPQGRHTPFSDRTTLFRRVPWEGRGHSMNFQNSWHIKALPQSLFVWQPYC